MLTMQIACWLGCLLVAQATGTEAVTREAPKPKIIFWHLAPGDGASPEFTSQMETTLRKFFDKQRGGELMSGMAMDSLLLVDGNEKYLRCGTGTTCLAGLGKTAEVGLVISGSLSVVDELSQLELVLVNADQQKRIATARISAKGLPKTEQMLELEVAMFDPDRYVGALELSSAVAGAAVFVDGKQVGMTPLVGPLANLSAGEHELEVKKLGHQTFIRRVHVPVGKTVQVVALLPDADFLRPKEYVPFYKDWPFWTAAGTGLAATAVAVFLHRDASILQDNADLKESLHWRDWQADQDAADSRYLQAYIVYGVGGAGLLAAGLIAIFDIALNAPLPENDQAGSEPSPVPNLHLWPDGQGASAVWRF